MSELCNPGWTIIAIAFLVLNWNGMRFLWAFRNANPQDLHKPKPFWASPLWWFDDSNFTEEGLRWRREGFRASLRALVIIACAVLIVPELIRLLPFCTR